MKKSFSERFIQDFQRHKYKYLVVLPVVIYLILFHYKPMYGIIVAFKDYRPTRGVADSPWVGLKHFYRYFNDIYFFRTLRNTLAISLWSIVFSFPAPILLALLLNEVKVSWFKRTVQTITYMPHFISLVIVCGLISTYSQTNGLFNDIIEFFGGERKSLLSEPDLFYPIYILSGIWKEVGWGSIIYLAALSGIDQEQYEAARVDGAGRLRQMFHITLPGIIPMISIQLILKMGSILGVGYEKILLLYQPLTYEKADVISTYVYRKGFVDGDFSFSTAVNVFNSLVNIIFLLASNRISKKAGQSGLF